MAQSEEGWLRNYQHELTPLLGEALPAEAPP